MSLQAIKRRKEIWEALHPGGKTFSTRGTDGTFAKGDAKEKGFAADTAKSSGMTKQAINQHVARAEALGDDINRVVGTSLESAEIRWDKLSHLNCSPSRARDQLRYRSASIITGDTAARGR